MFCSDLISVFLEFSSSFPFSSFDFEAVFYLFIVCFFLYKQYSGRSFFLFFSHSTQKILETRTGFCKPRHTVKNERKEESDSSGFCSKGEVRR